MVASSKHRATAWHPAFGESRQREQPLRTWPLPNGKGKAPLRVWPDEPLPSRLLFGLTRRRLLLMAALVLAGLAIFRGVAYFEAYQDVRAARATLVEARELLGEQRLSTSEDEARRLRADLARASSDLAAAEDLIDSDPLLAALKPLPWVGDQLNAAQTIAQAGIEAAAIGQESAGLVIDLDEVGASGTDNALAGAVQYLEQTDRTVAAIDDHRQRLQGLRSELGDGSLAPPLSAAREELDLALTEVEDLVHDYQLASEFIPLVLGFEGPRSYLILPQNNTELFPSGGLISSYGVVTLERGRLSEPEFEDYIDLFLRWQAESEEYVEPPQPLKEHLLREISWGLGEAGWYPDFPSTAAQATFFIERGGVPPVDGVIAIDLFFVQDLLRITGPLTIPEYGATVDAGNVTEVTLEATRQELSPGSGRKAFLSYLAEGLMEAIFALPRDKWNTLVDSLGRLAEERHLQVFAEDLHTQELAIDLGLAGEIEDGGTDFLLLADASVNSTKLNLVLDNHVDVDLVLRADGSVHHTVQMGYDNRLPEWAEGREPALVEALMLDGLYGSYLRLFAPADSALLDVLVDGEVAGASAVEEELGLASFGRYLTVPAGAQRQATFIYDNQGATREGDRLRYRLVLQKQAGTEAIPLSLSLALPAGAVVVAAWLDGEPLEPADLLALESDLRTDRVLEVIVRLADGE